MTIKKSELIKNKGKVESQALDLTKAEKDFLDKLNGKVAEMITKKYIDKDEE